VKKFTYLLLTFLLFYNAYLFQNELKIKSDVNDNSFQFALINEQKQIWDKVLVGKVSPSYLFDNFNVRWNEGFSLNMYYAHLPQAAIALLGYFKIIPLFDWFNLIKYLLLVLLPTSFYISARKLKFSYLQSFFAALFSQLIFTDGLYGIDLTSYVWRGWGLFSQQLAVFFLPLAFAYTIKYFEEEKGLIGALIFNFLVAQSHVGIFLILSLCYPLFLITCFDSNKINKSQLVLTLKRLLIFAFSLFFLMAYFLIPFFLYSNYRNFSYWDPMWKFDSFGWQQIVTWFLNGSLFDFNRLPILTFTIIFAILFFLKANKKLFNYLLLIFGFYFVLFFGRVNLGKLIDLIPGLSEFHLHRFIVMVQMVAIFIGAGFLGEVIESLKSKRKYFIATVALVIGFLIYGQKPILKYMSENNQWLMQDRINYKKDLRNYEKLVKKLHSLSFARVYAGRPGNWGRELKVGGTQIYMALSKDGFPTIGFAPESWSPNSEYDQFFNEYMLEHYNLYNVRYIIASNSIKPQEFYRLIDKFGKYYLYEVETAGWFEFGKTKSVVSGNKNNYINIVKYWLSYIWPKTKEYPRIAFKNTTDGINLINESSYKYLNKEYNLWQQQPFPITDLSIKDEVKKEEESVDFNNYKVKFKLNKDCRDCILILKNTYHPNWQIFINGKEAKGFPVFPFYIGVPVSEKGDYQVEVVYRPGGLKILLLVGEIIIITTVIIIKKDKLFSLG